MLTALLFSADLTSSEMRSFMSLPGREDQKTASLEIPVPAKKSTSISAIPLSVDRWLMKIVFFSFFPCVALVGLCVLYSANRSLYVLAELFRMTKYGSLSAHLTSI